MEIPSRTLSNRRIRFLQFREAVATVIKSAITPLTVSEVTRRSPVTNYREGYKTVSNHITSLLKAGYVTRSWVVRKGKDQPVYGYSWVIGKELEKAPGVDTAADPADPAYPTAPAVTQEEPKKGNGSSAPHLPDVKMTLIESTGRLRIEFKSLCIEIGAA